MDVCSPTPLVATPVQSAFAAKLLARRWDISRTLLVVVCDASPPLSICCQRFGVRLF